MDLEQAKEEATRRWRVLGGWADEEVAPDGTTQRISRVGIRRPAPGGLFTEKVVLGRAGTFERAFEAAEKWWERQGQPYKPRPKPQVGYPTMEMF